MKKICLLVAMSILVTFGWSSLSMATQSNYADGTTPQPFVELGNNGMGPDTWSKDSLAISTGYYFMDVHGSDEWAAWKPTENYFTPLTFEPSTWYRILSGPRQAAIVGIQNGNIEGKPFFRNPSFSKNFDLNDKVSPVDSTNSAIAGPIPLNFAFYFNGIRYDSFYVSAKGMLALSNRRYFYDNQGKRIIPAGSSTCYDPMSADWFEPTREAARLAHEGLASLNDQTPDNYGYVYVACGGDTTKIQGGLRDTASTGASTARRNDIQDFLKVPGGAYISPFYGPFFLSQYDSVKKVNDDYSQVWYKRSISSDKIIIYYKNLMMLPGTYSLAPAPNERYTISAAGRPVYSGAGDFNVLSGSCQVVLNRVDSSITFVYDEFRGSVRYGGIYVTNSVQFMRPFMLMAVGGYARQTGYDSKAGGTETIPWASEYTQYTQQLYGSQGASGANDPYFVEGQYSIKFKQWRNALRLVDVQYMIRSKNKTDNLDYSIEVTTADVQDKYDPFELFAGEERLGSMQPVAIVQNLTNEKQGTRGVNFVKQDFQFQARMRIRNVAYDKFVYNKVAKISDYCLRLPDKTSDPKCSQDPYASVRYSEVTKDDKGNYKGTTKDMVANQNGIPSYEFAKIKFSAHIPMEYEAEHLGIMEAQAITEAIDPNTGEVIGDTWPFDDSSKVRFWVITRLKEFKDNVSDKNYHHIDTDVPSIEKWVHNSNAGPNIVGAPQMTDHPMPPLGVARAKNDTTKYFTTSPCIQMNWNPNDKNDNIIGDKITSFPIDLRGRNGSVITLSVQRSGNTVDTKRGFADDRLVGPEGRVVFNGGYNNGNRTGTWTSADAPNFDYLAVEFLKNSPDGIKNVTNTGTDNIKGDNYWKYRPVWEKGKGVTSALTDNASALAIYGGGGYFLGWSFADKKVYQPAVWEGTIQYNGKIVAGVMYNPYDIGFDYEFYKYSVPIPDYYIDGDTATGGKNFRFRIKVVDSDVAGGAGDNRANQNYPADDRDEFYIDNIAVMMPNSENPLADIEMAAVKIIWPYSEVPASQANDLDVIVRFTNISVYDANPFTIKTKIFKGSVATGNPIYCRTVQQASLKSGNTVELTFPQFSARKFGAGEYTLQSMIIYPGKDFDSSNDTTEAKFSLTFGEDIAYDSSASNEVDDLNIGTGIKGKGLNLLGASFSGYNKPVTPPAVQTFAVLRDTTRSYFAPITYDNNIVPYTEYAAGGSLQKVLPGYPPYNGALSGQIAVKFVLSASDTLKGAKAMFAAANQAFNDISFDVYKDNGTGKPSNSLKIGTSRVATLYARRLLAKNAAGIEASVPKIGEFVTYEFARPLYLEKGTYWISIGQLGETGIELAATGNRMAMKTTYLSATAGGELGNSGIQLMVDKQLRVPTNDADFGRVYKNNNLFAYENIIYDNNWYEFMPTQGHVAYAHLDHFGTTKSPSPGTGFRTMTRGTWLPLLRPYFGKKTESNDTTHTNCPDDLAGGQPIPPPDPKDTVKIPVTLLSIQGFVRENGVELTWETTSEVDNYGFRIDKANADTEEWKELTFVKGTGTPTSGKVYRHTDNNVKDGETYLYRLQEIDKDGVVGCPFEIVQVKYNNIRSIALEQNEPNPFNDATRIKLYMPTAEIAKLEVVDVLGKVIRTIVADELLSIGDQSFEWNGRDDAGNKVTTGNYLIKLTVGNEIISKKMSYIKNN